MSQSYPVAVVVLLLVASACSDDGTPSTDPVGGAGGSSGASGSAGASGTGGTPPGTGGTSGSAGTGGSADGPDASVPRFQAVIDGGFVRVSSDDPVWVRACGDDLSLVQQVDGAWIPLQDDRPEDVNLEFDSHYLDGTYRPYCTLTAGCDVSACLPIESVSGSSYEQRAHLIPRELARVGQGAAPTCELGDAGVPFDAGVDLDAGIQRVPAIESRAPRGPLAVRIRYYTSDDCESPFAIVDVPVE